MYILILIIIIIIYYRNKRNKNKNQNNENETAIYKSIRENNLYDLYYEKQKRQNNIEYNREYTYTYTNKYNTIQKENNNNYKFYYKPRIYITTLNELKFYNVLLEIAKELDLILFAQVSLYSIISVNERLNKSNQQKYFNKISRKSIDFVMVNKENCKIKLCIELDDTTHLKNQRKERDNFINELFEELNIPLLRYPCYNIYYKNTLKEKIIEKIRDYKKI